MKEKTIIGDGKTTMLVDKRLLLQLVEDLQVVNSAPYGNFRGDSIVGDNLKETTTIIEEALKETGWNVNSQ